MEFGERIRQMRKQRKISQEMLGIQVGVGQGAVSGWETQGTEPPLSVIVKLADVFGVTTDYLLGRTDTPLTLASSSSSYAEVTPFERDVLQRYREASEETKINICAILRLTHPAELRGKIKQA